MKYQNYRISCMTCSTLIKMHLVLNIVQLVSWSLICSILLKIQKSKFIVSIYYCSFNKWTKIQEYLLRFSGKSAYRYMYMYLTQNRSSHIIYINLANISKITVLIFGKRFQFLNSVFNMNILRLWRKQETNTHTNISMIYVWN